jgi:hypothetical protein
MPDLTPEGLQVRADQWLRAQRAGWLWAETPSAAQVLASAFTTLVADARRAQREADGREAWSRACAVPCLHDECKRARVIYEAIRAQEETP